MRRTLAILKYLPAVLCGLLVMAWVLSLYCYFGYSTSNVSVGVFGGSVHCIRARQTSQGVYAALQPNLDHQTYLGELHNQPHPLTGDPHAGVPIALILGAMLPLSLATFTKFRFPLWSYFAWTALIAAELAYYLR